MRGLIAIFLFLISVPVFSAKARLTPILLKCEGRIDPVGIDTPHPRFSWTLESNERAQKQTAYHLLVASSREQIERDNGDLWDSGRIVSGNTIPIEYAGRPLRSWMRCWWKVRVWDKQGQSSAWSAPAAWTMGLLNKSDWKASWIMFDPSSATGEQPLTFDDAQWIWFDGEENSMEPTRSVPAETRYFRAGFPLPEGVDLRAARLLITVDNEFSLFVNGNSIDTSDERSRDWQRPQVFEVAAWLRPGTNVLAVEAVNVAPSPAGLIAKLVIEPAGQEPFVLVSGADWKSSNIAPEGWQEPDYDDRLWPDAKAIGEFGCPPWGLVSLPKPYILPLFRREFNLTQPVARASIAICGLGFYELRLNGEKVGDAVLDPGWTNYRKTCLYATYEITEQLRGGGNTLGVMLGNGMYNVIGGRYTKFQGSFGEPKLITQLHIEFADGKTMDIGSNSSWRAAPSPITFSCIYGGEDYDARLEQPGWDRPGFDDSAWQAATLTDGPGGRLVAQSAPPIRVMQVFKTKRVTEPRPGIFVYDLGQNFSGWPRLTVRGQAGAIVRMTPGELLDGDGKVTQHGSGGPSYFQYILKGQGNEVWHPRFTYYGFRYVQVEGAAPQADPSHPGQALVLDLEGHFVHNSAQTVGQFACSNPLFNRIHEIILVAIRSNMQSVFTDCPHREKLGWLEETHLMGPSIMYNHDVQSLCRKIIRDMSEAQTEEGLVPDIAPEYTVFSGAFRDAPAWGSAYVILPWYLYEWYGDREILQTHYDGIKRYVDYLTSRAEDHIVSYGLGDWCDIGPAPYGPSQLTPIALTGTAIYYQDLTTLAKIAALLGRENDAGRYASLARDVRRAFNKRFFDSETKQYATGSQTSNAMPLVLGLVEPANAAAVLENLVQDVRAHNNHLTAGDVGHRYVVQALAEGGRSDVVFDMTDQTDPPSYGFQVEHGATTLTETWDPRLGFSQNHFMMGHVEEWFYRSLAGIDRDPRGAGFDRFLIRPQLVGDLTWVKASYRSIRGRISVEWRIDGGDWDLKVTIPPNTTATVYVPASDIDKVTESGRPAAESEGVRFLGMEAGSAVFEVGSGNYAFGSQQLRKPYSWSIK